ncbi:DUF2937 family protein [Neptunicoccus cionae]|uniref:DUF2937 domain-containing protein n=1 Tax=Neptunicoccus cionae TaxID=2035344 RepID=A0A916QV71_9RHOB|nr:DUF2937 family protein [Amylibacter cionae]GGA13919.1 hypothetical protein GCM10011498_12470 [Amylibacter cionae]
MGQILNVGGGVILLVAASQFPEYTQQYVQRLGGAVDELRLVAADFDKSAQNVGLTRYEALESMTGNAFQKARQNDMRRTFARLDGLQADLAVLNGAGPFERLSHVSRFSDQGIAARAWQDFRPAVPLTIDGFLFAMGGFFAGFGLLRGLGLLMRRRKRPLTEVTP